MQIDRNHALQILDKSTILYKADELYPRIKEMAIAIDSEITAEIPVFLNVMNGSLFFGAELLKHIKSPIICDYIHASRYGNVTFGAEHIMWYRQPKPEDIRGRTIYIIDDVLDEGHTLAEIVHFLYNAGAKKCKVVVLVNKEISKAKPIIADYIGVTAPNHFLFGFGMDIYGLYRQLPDIYCYNS